MKTQITVKELLKPLSTVISAVESKQTLPILSHVLIQLKDNLLTLTTTDMEIEISCCEKIKASETAKFTIYAKNLIDIIRKLPEKTIIKFDIKKDKINLNINNSTFELNTFDTTDFPALPVLKNSETIKIPAATLKELIENISFSMGNNDIRAYLNGLYFEADKDNIIAVATDGHRLAVGKIKQKNPLKATKTIIIPKKAILEISKILEKDNSQIELHLTDNYFYLISENTTIISRLIDGNFPNYAQVIPTDYDNTIIVNREEFLTNLDQASIFVEDQTNRVTLNFKAAELHISSHSERGQAKLQIATKNFKKELEISFNIRYLIPILEKLTTPEINIIIPDGENQTCLLTNTESQDYQYVVMPIRL